MIAASTHSTTALLVVQGVEGMWYVSVLVAILPLPFPTPAASAAADDDG